VDRRHAQPLDLVQANSRPRPSPGRGRSVVSRPGGVDASFGIISRIDILRRLSVSWSCAEGERSTRIGRRACVWGAGLDGGFVGGRHG
jgi:hypothetical protein